LAALPQSRFRKCRIRFEPNTENVPDAKTLKTVESDAIADERQQEELVTDVKHVPPDRRVFEPP